MWCHYKCTLSFCIGIFCLFSCSDKSDNVDVPEIPQGTWGVGQASGMPVPRKEFLTFSGAGQGETYLGFGLCIECPSYPDETEHEYADLWKHDASGWKQKSSCPGRGRVGAVAFTIKNKAYVGLGKCNTNWNHQREYFGDFWRYDMITDEWEEVEYVFPGRPRAYAVAFSVNGKGYVGTGSNDDEKTLKDFYEFDPETGWKEISFPGDSRWGGTAFVVDEQGYVGLGRSAYDKAIVDFYRFNPKDGSWKAITGKPLGGLERFWAVSAVLYKDEKPYVYFTGGKKEMADLSSCWGYDPRKDEWMEVTPLPAGVGNIYGGFAWSRNKMVLYGENNPLGCLFSLGD